MTTVTRQALSCTELVHFLYPHDNSIVMARPKLRQPVIEVLDGIKEEYGYGSYDEAVTHALREAGYNV